MNYELLLKSSSKCDKLLHKPSKQYKKQQKQRNVFRLFIDHSLSPRGISDCDLHGDSRFDADGGLRRELREIQWRLEQTRITGNMSVLLQWSINHMESLLTRDREPFIPASNHNACAE